MAMTELAIRLPKPHPKQASFRASEAKRKVIVAGRRGGKTTGAGMIAVEAMLQGRRVLEAAPTADQTGAFWHFCKKALAEPIAAGVVYKNESDHILEMPGGARIRTKTAWDADSLRGDYADLLILDEYSLMKPSAWDEVGAPMLLDNDGDAVFIFTPQRKNHAHSLYAQAIGDTAGRQEAWHFTSFDNPYLNQAALAEIVKDMTDEAYRQEIMAEFLDNEGAVFRNIGACMGAPTGASPNLHRGHVLGMGVDWGKQNDFTALSIVCQDCRCEVVLDRFNKIDYTFQRLRLKALADAWGVRGILAESNAMGVPIIEELRRAGLSVTPFETTAQSKPPLVENLALALEQVEFQWLPDRVGRSELEAYERHVTAGTGRSTYGAPEGVHDDTVIARALALRSVQRAGRTTRSYQG